MQSLDFLKSAGVAQKPTARKYQDEIRRRLISQWSRAVLPPIVRSPYRAVHFHCDTLIAVDQPDSMAAWNQSGRVIRGVQFSSRIIRLLAYSQTQLARRSRLSA